MSLIIEGDYLTVSSKVDSLVRQQRTPSLFPLTEGGAIIIVPDKPIPDKHVHWQTNPDGTFVFIDHSRGEEVSSASSDYLSPDQARRVQRMLAAFRRVRWRESYLFQYFS